MIVRAPAEVSVEIRRPWPDELWRVQRFVPTVFLYDASPRLDLVVRGRAERIVGVCALSMQPLRRQRAGWVAVSVEERPERPEWLEALLRRALAAAWDAGAERVGYGHGVTAGSADSALLRRMGFVTHEVHEIYQLSTPEAFRRIDRIYRRLRAGGGIPSGAELSPITPAVLGAARAFLAEHLPRGIAALALENSGYAAGSSLLLWVDGKIQGLLLGRATGNVAYVGLRAVAKELRGGLGWANLMLLHASTELGIQNGVEWTRFELNPDLHGDTQQLARGFDAKLLEHVELFRMERPEKP